MPECATFRPFSAHATPQDVKGFFEDVFRLLDLHPQALDVVLDFGEADLSAPIIVDFEAGDPVFRQADRNSAHARLGGRWLAEHDVPFPLSFGKTRFFLTPAEGNRIRVQPRTLKMWYNALDLNLKPNSERRCNT